MFAPKKLLGAIVAGLIVASALTACGSPQPTNEALTQLRHEQPRIERSPELEHAEAVLTKEFSLNYDLIAIPRPERVEAYARAVCRIEQHGGVVNASIYSSLIAAMRAYEGNESANISDVMRPFEARVTELRLQADGCDA